MAARSASVRGHSSLYHSSLAWRVYMTRLRAGVCVGRRKQRYGVFIQLCARVREVCWHGDAELQWWRVVRLEPCVRTDATGVLEPNRDCVRERDD